MSDAGGALQPGFHRSMLLVSMLFVAIMAAIDLTIVSVSLPYMAGALSATPDEIVWVVTLFAIGQALVIGITGHLSRLLGRKRLAIIAIIGFVSTSAACGLSQDLDTIVAFRFVQGLFSGPLVPLSQSVLIDAYPPEERTRSLALWAMGATLGPAVGPALGGLLTQELDWRWVFWVNFPLGIVALVLVLSFVRPVAPQNVRTDWLGLALLATFLICMQVGLNQGDRLDWFSSREIVVLLLAAVAGFIVFTSRGIRLGERNIINLHLLGDSNFAVCSLLMGLAGISFLAFMVIAPDLYVDLLGWEISTAGFAVGLSGSALVVASQIANPLMRLVGKRGAVIVGILVTAGGWYQFGALNADVSPLQVIAPGAMIFAGIMLTFPVIAAQAFIDVPAALRDEAAGLFNLIKTIGLSLGATIVATLVYRGTQENWTRMAGFLDPTRPGYSYFVQQSGFEDASVQTGALLFEVIASQSYLLTYTQTAQSLAIFTLCGIPLTLLMRRSARPADGSVTDGSANAAA